MDELCAYGTHGNKAVCSLCEFQSTGIIVIRYTTKAEKL